MADGTPIARRIRVPLGFAFAILYLWLADPRAASVAGGSAIAALGLLIRGFASGHVQKNEQLATSGPYAYVRNPLYLGSIVLAIGFAVTARSWWIVGGIVLLLILVYLPVIRSEEAFLRARFPEFAEYMRSVPQLVPRLTPFSAARGSFSWQLYVKHREYNAFLGAVIMSALLLAKLHWFSAR